MDVISISLIVLIICFMVIFVAEEEYEWLGFSAIGLLSLCLLLWALSLLNPIKTENIWTTDRAKIANQEIVFNEPVQVTETITNYPWSLMWDEKEYKISIKMEQK